MPYMLGHFAYIWPNIYESRGCGDPLFLCLIDIDVRSSCTIWFINSDRNYDPLKLVESGVEKGIINKFATHWFYSFGHRYIRPWNCNSTHLCGSHVATMRLSLSKKMCTLCRAVSDSQSTSNRSPLWTRYRPCTSVTCCKNDFNLHNVIHDTILNYWYFSLYYE